jgi:hypothetical protein
MRITLLDGKEIYTEALPHHWDISDVDKNFTGYVSIAGFNKTGIAIIRCKPACSRFNPHDRRDVPEIVVGGYGSAFTEACRILPLWPLNGRQVLPDES